MSRGWRGRLLMAAVVGMSVVSGTGVLEAGPRPWDVLRHDTPYMLWSGLFQTVDLTLHNPGREPWSDATSDHLSYHWRSSGGEVVRYDGQRTHLPRTVAPGDVVEVTARVQTPPRSGWFVLEWEMVRENVGWYGPPAGGQRLQVRVLVVRRHAVLQLMFLAAAVGIALAVRRLHSSRGGSWAWLARSAVPVLLTWLGLALLVLCFSELSGKQLADGTWPLVLAASALLTFPVAVVPVRTRAWVAVAVVGVATCLTLADLAYLRFFGTVVPVVAAAAVDQVGQIEGSISALLWLSDFWVVLATAAVLAYALLTVRWPRVTRPGPATRHASVVGGLVWCLLGGVPALQLLTHALHDPTLADQLFSQELLVARWGVANVHLFDAARTVREWWASGHPDETERRRVEAVLAATRGQQAARHPLFGVARGKNLLLIQVESLHQWVVKARVGGQPVMPYLSSLVDRGLYFTNVFDQTGQGRSSDGEFITLNSLHALDRGAVVFRRPHNQFLALPEVLRRHGYASLSAHPFDRGFWNRAVMHPKYGFERMLFRPELGPGEVIGWGLADEPFFRRMLPELQGLRQPFFAFLVTLGLHHPFDLFPDIHKELDVGGIADTPLGNYIHAMHYFDQSFARLVQDLDRVGLLDDTVVALYGDHESGLAIDAALMKLASVPSWDPSVPVRLRKVPLVVLLPAGAPAGEVAVVGGQIDTAPTLLTYLGVEPPASFVGRPLGLDPGGFAVLYTGAAVSGDRMFVPSGTGIDAGGVCFSFPTGARRPRGDCGELEVRGREELQASRWVVLHDQIGRLAGPEPGRSKEGGS